MAKTKPLPEVIFVTQEKDGDDHYFYANENAEDLVGGEDNDPVVVGAYRLTGSRRLRKTVVVVEAEE